MALLASGIVGLIVPGAQGEATATTTVATSTTATTLPTPTTSLQSTTTTTVALETLTEFVDRFRAALDADDLGFVFSRLHPQVIAGFGDALCRAWVDREILVLEEYELTGEPGPVGEQQVETPAGDLPVADVFTAPIRFIFQGQTFESEGSFAYFDGLIYWMGQCR
ncbi:MAG: hypothetical protein L0Z49_07310 [Actinobacteria bacterium]|nr:hypothetical protein [Actinomycetota bacterium]MCI0544242.1 hypothetical protein [Actinomycetota bacterium]